MVKTIIYLTTWVVLSLGLLASCGDNQKERLSRQELMNPDTCEECHPKHFEEWSSSMHAYAGDDPIFLAMNKRGQRETNGVLGDFCIKCHAPMALVEGATFDGLNLDEVPQHLKGVTCYFCHNVTEVAGTHNNPLVIANDQNMRAGIADPVENNAHGSLYSPLHDRDNVQSAALCGSCHDIETENIRLERTFSEWKDSVFARAPFEQTCGNCHMRGVDDVVADFEGVKVRRRHAHYFPAVDTALIPWPGKEKQKELIQEELRTAVQSRLCYDPSTNSMELSLTNVAGGHMFPSGSAQDRRAWVEFSAKIGEEVVVQSGLIADGESIDDIVDPLLWRMHDRGFNANDETEHMFWNITRIESKLLPPSVTFDVSSPAYDHSRRRLYAMGEHPMPDRVDVVVRLRAVDLALIDDLIASGDLDPKYRERIETYDLEGSRIVWTPETAGSNLCVP